MNKRRICVFTLIAVLLVSIPASAKTMYVKQAAKLFKSNSTKAAVIKTLNPDTKLNVLATKNGWAKVKVGDKGGFVQSGLLTAQKPTPSPSPLAQTMYVTENVKLTKTASASGKVLAKLTKGAQVSLISEKGVWGKVTASGKTGFIRLAKLTDSPLSPAKDDVPATPAASPEYETLAPGDSGEAVKKLQTRLKALEWFYGDIGGNYKELTTQAVKDFQEAAGLKTSGIADNATQLKLYDKNAPKNVIDSTAKPASGKAVEMDWWTSDIQTRFPRGATAVVTDVVTGLSFRAHRKGGTNHADVQPLTAKDTAVMKKIYGGAWSWDRRAIWVSIKDDKFAASMNGMPHGDSSIADNNFGGHFCIHFTNSRTHGTNAVDALHQAAIKRAAGK